MKKKRKVAKRKPVAKRKKVVKTKKVKKVVKAKPKAKKKAVKAKAVRRGRPKGSKNKTQLLTPTLVIAPIPVLVGEVLVVEAPTPVETVVVETPTLVEIPLNADGTKTDTEQ